MARKTKYDSDTFPQLAQGYARDGLSDVQIAKNLGISLATYYEYQLKYPEFTEAIKKGKSPVDIEVENALLKRALGYEYTETQIVKRNGKTVETKTITKHIPSETAAAIFWLINRKPNHWTNKQKVEHSGGITCLTDLIAAANKDETQ